ncbi:MAG: hypothetical protein WCI42_04295 [Verrucomicrobiota bacterium]
MVNSTLKIERTRLLLAVSVSICVAMFTSSCSSSSSEATQLVNKACSETNLSGAQPKDGPGDVTPTIGDEVRGWKHGSQIIAKAAKLDPRWTNLVTSFQVEEQSWRYEAEAIGMKAPDQAKKQSSEQRSRAYDLTPAGFSDLAQAAWQDIKTMCAIAGS